MSFRLDVREARGSLVLAPLGVLDAGSAEVVVCALEAQLDCGLRALVLDLGQVSRVEGAAEVHRRLAELQRRARARGAAVRLDSVPPELAQAAA